MRICFIADLRSSIARSWISGFTRVHDIHVLSTASAPPLPGVTVHELSSHRDESEWRSLKASWSAFLDPMSRIGRWVGSLHDHLVQPARTPVLAARAKRILAQLQPRIVHSLRIPLEGEIGAIAVRQVPHIMSAWGNDFTLYADRSLLHRVATRRALSGCAGFLADARADVERAHQHGLPREIPTLVAPGSGGIRPEVFSGEGPEDWTGDLAPIADVPRIVPVVVNPRGFRRYVRNDSFFEAVRMVLLGSKRPLFVGVGMKGWKPIEALVQRLGLSGHVILTGPLSQVQLAALYRRASVAVSPTEHDGTPNSLLEAMACGCFPVCGELPSIREWIDDGKNGLLINPDQPAQLASAIRRALSDEELRRNAAIVNAELIDRHARYERCIEAAESFYQRICSARRHVVEESEVFS